MWTPLYVACSLYRDWRPEMYGEGLDRNPPKPLPFKVWPLVQQDRHRWELCRSAASQAASRTCGIRVCTFTRAAGDFRAR